MLDGDAGETAAPERDPAIEQRDGTRAASRSFAGNGNRQRPVLRGPLSPTGEKAGEGGPSLQRGWAMSASQLVQNASQIGRLGPGPNGRGLPPS